MNRQQTEISSLLHKWKQAEPNLWEKLDGTFESSYNDLVLLAVISAINGKSWEWWVRSQILEDEVITFSASVYYPIEGFKTLQWHTSGNFEHPAIALLDVYLRALEDIKVN